MYEITKKTVLIDKKRIDTYGVKNEFEEINNISTKRYFVEQIVYTLNAKNVSPSRFRCVVDDLIALN